VSGGCLRGCQGAVSCYYVIRGVVRGSQELMRIVRGLSAGCQRVVRVLSGGCQRVRCQVVTADCLKGKSGNLLSKPDLNLF